MAEKSLDNEELLSILREVFNGLFLDSPFESIKGQCNGSLIELIRVFVKSAEAFTDIMKIN